jgi:hypothetical protein
MSIRNDGIERCLSLFLGIGTAFLLVLGMAVTVTHAGQVSGPANPPQADEPGQSVPLQGNNHIQSPGSPHIPYNSDPPTSGPHVPFIVRWGIHKVPIPREIQVHNLEDGGVIIQYNCNNCSELVARLEAIVQQYQKKAEIERSKTGSKHPSRYEHLILAPYPGMDVTIAMTAWGKIDKFNEFDEARIARFIEAYIGIDHHPAREE